MDGNTEDVSHENPASGDPPDPPNPNTPPAQASSSTPAAPPKQGILLRAFEKENQGNDTEDTTTTTTTADPEEKKDPLTNGRSRMLAASVVGGMKEKWLKALVAENMARAKLLQERLDSATAQIQLRDERLKDQEEKNAVLVAEYEVAVQTLLKATMEVPEGGLPNASSAELDRLKEQKLKDQKVKDQIQMQFLQRKLATMEETLQARDQTIAELQDHAASLETQMQNSAGEQGESAKEMTRLRQRAEELQTRLFAQEQEAETQKKEAEKKLTALKSDGMNLLATINTLKQREAETAKRLAESEGRPPERVEVEAAREIVNLVGRQAAVLSVAYTEPPPPPPPAAAARPVVAHFAQQADLQPDEAPVITAAVEEVNDAKSKVKKALASNADDENAEKITKALKKEERLQEEDEVLQTVNKIVKKMRAVAKAQAPKGKGMDVIARMEQMVELMRQKWDNRRLAICDERRRELMRVLSLIGNASGADVEEKTAPEPCTCTCTCSHCRRAPEPDPQFQTMRSNLVSDTGANEVKVPVQAPMQAKGHLPAMCHTVQPKLPIEGVHNMATVGQQHHQQQQHQQPQQQQIHQQQLQQPQQQQQSSHPQPAEHPEDPNIAHINKLHSRRDITTPGGSYYATLQQALMNNRTVSKDSTVQRPTRLRGKTKKLPSLIS